jgi:hypothetical protein
MPDSDPESRVRIGDEEDGGPGLANLLWDGAGAIT